MESVRFIKGEYQGITKVFSKYEDFYLIARVLERYKVLAADAQKAIEELKSDEKFLDDASQHPEQSGAKF